MEANFVTKLFLFFCFFVFLVFFVSLYVFVYLSMTQRRKSPGQGELCSQCRCILLQHRWFPKHCTSEQIFRSFGLTQDSLVGNSIIVSLPVVVYVLSHGKTWELKCLISSYSQSQGVHSNLNPNILFALYYVLHQCVGEREGSKSQKSFCVPFQHPFEYM